ncbi:hypothetical protein MRX96_058874 [Rhipicephalus microplus]
MDSTFTTDAPPTVSSVVKERDVIRPYVVLCMSYAGRPLNKVKFESALQIRSVVQQVSLTLAVSEAALEFEHRALTPSHVLVREALDQVVPFCLNGHTLRVDMFGVHVSLIDLSTARLTPVGQETVILGALVLELSKSEASSACPAYPEQGASCDGALSQVGSARRVVEVSVGRKRPAWTWRQDMVELPALGQYQCMARLS